MNSDPESPSLSLVIPALNEAVALPELLSQLQVWRDHAEIILVDGGSEDTTCAVAEPLVDQLLHSAPGRALQMNSGAAVARGQYLLFLHCDTRLQIAPGDFCLQLEQLPDWGFFRVALTGRDWRLRVVEFAMNWRARLTAVATGDQCLFLSREAWLASGGFANIALMEDVELCKRLRRRCRPLRVEPAVLTSSRRWERFGLFRTVWLMWSLRWRYWRGADPAELARLYYR